MALPLGYHTTYALQMVTLLSRGESNTGTWVAW